MKTLLVAIFNLCISMSVVGQVSENAWRDYWRDRTDQVKVVSRSFVFSAIDAHTQWRPYNHVSTILEMPDGRLLASWSSGPHEFSTSIVLNGSTSRDSGKTWSTASPLVRMPTKEVIVTSPAFVRKGKRVWLFYGEYGGKVHDDSETIWKDFGSLESIWVKHSDDSGETWSEPVHPTEDYAALRSNGIVLSSGEIIMPILHWQPKPEGSWDDIYGGVLRSTDEGVTWKRHGSVLGDEPAVVELQDGSLLMYLRRNDGWIWESRSRDKGVTWSLAARTKIAAPETAHYLYRLKDGRILLAYNDHPTQRTALSIRISRDGGKTWGLPTLIDACTLQIEPDIEEYTEVAYPTVTQLSNGNLGMVWSDIRYDPKYRRAGKTFAWHAIMRAKGVIKFAEIAVSPDWEPEKKVRISYPRSPEYPTADRQTMETY